MIRLIAFQAHRSCCVIYLLLVAAAAVQQGRYAYGVRKIQIVINAASVTLEGSHEHYPKHLRRNPSPIVNEAAACVRLVIFK